MEDVLGPVSPESDEHPPSAKILVGITTGTGELVRHDPHAGGWEARSQSLNSI